MSGEGRGGRGTIREMYNRRQNRVGGGEAEGKGGKEVELKKKGKQ